MPIQLRAEGERGVPDIEHSADTVPELCECGGDEHGAGDEWVLCVLWIGGTEQCERRLRRRRGDGGAAVFRDGGGLSQLLHRHLSAVHVHRLRQLHHHLVLSACQHRHAIDHCQGLCLLLQRLPVRLPSFDQLQSRRVLLILSLLSLVLIP